MTLKADSNYLRPVVCNFGFVELLRCVCYLRGIFLYFKTIIAK